jgi:isopenicillin-N epimerase
MCLSDRLSIPDSIEFGASLLPGGWPALRDRNRDLALRGRDLLCAALGIEPPAPDAMIGCMASVPLPMEAPGAAPAVELYGDAVHAGLQEHGIQVAIAPWPSRPEDGAWRRLVRVSAATYVSTADLELLARVLPSVVATPAGLG